MTIFSPGLFDWTILALAALVAGIANAVAGGGSFFIFSALIAAGMPSLEANITTAVSLMPAGFASAFAYRSELRMMSGRLIPVMVLGALGGFAGAWILLRIGNEGFRPLVPWLLAFATLVFALSGHLRRWVTPFIEGNGRTATLLAYGLMILVSIYGGFFGAGASIMLLAVLAILEGGDFHRANAMKIFVGMGMITPVVIAFCFSGHVHWPSALLAIAVSMVSGYFGVAVARMVPEAIIRWIVVISGAVLSVMFFVR